jgi:hypothetical protein
VFGLAAAGDLPPVIDALNDAGRQFVREAAVAALSASLAAAPDGVDLFRRLLIDKLALKDEQAAQAVRLLRGVADSERRNPEALDRLVEALASDVRVVRELAFWALQNVSDPAAPPPRPAVMYDAAAPPEVREAGARAWTRYVEQLKKVPAESKAPDKK